METGLLRLREAASLLASRDPATESAATLTERVIELRTLIDGLEGTWLRLLAAVDRCGLVDGGTGAWLRSECRLSPAAARTQVALARRLADRPAVATALTAGDISVEHARVVTTALAELADADERSAAAAEAPFLTVAGRLDPTRLRREIAHARHALLPEVAAAADEAVHARRHLDVARTFDGAVAVSGVLDPEGGETLLSALAALSDPAEPDDPRTPGQRRADALVQLCRQRLDSGQLPTTAGARPHLTVIVPLNALTLPAATRPPRPLGAPEASAGGVPTGAGQLSASAAGNPANAEHSGAFAGGDPTSLRRLSGGLVGGETSWGAVLGPEAVRRLACDASVSRVIVDPAGEPLDVGRRTRTIPAAIRTALVVRDRGCVFPGCDRPPPWTDAHHVRHWADGGATSLDNLVLLCRRHHRTVHEGRRPLVREHGRWRFRPDERAGPRAA